MQTFKVVVRRLMASAALLTLAMVPAALPVNAQSLSPAGVVASSASDACAGIGFTGGDCGGKAQADKVNNVIGVFINIFSAIVGLAAVLMIVIAGFKYITSGGDSSKVAGARNTIIYAIVGLIIVALAQFIVQFVIQKAK